MRFLSRLYALEFNEANLTLALSRRRCNSLIWAEVVGKQRARLRLNNKFPLNDGEALRLTLQWAFDVAGFAEVTAPMPRDPAEIAALGAGAGLGADGLAFTAARFADANRALGCRGQAWLERALPVVPVACIALVNNRDQVLLAQRPSGKSFEGLWEFPGGKVEREESPELALCREVDEELGLSISNSCLSPLTFVSHAYDDFHLTMLAYVCYKFEGRPEGREGQALDWWALDDLNPEQMPPANAPIIFALKELLG